MTPQELKNSILQLAIQGKLVEQRPEEGTAEELFSQIQQEKHIGNALACPEIEYVIFPYGLHGHRKELFERLWEETKRKFSDTCLIPLLLFCSPEENVRWAKADGRDLERIERGMKNSGNVYDAVDWPRIDVTELTPDETAQAMLRVIFSDTLTGKVWY